MTYKYWIEDWLESYVKPSVKKRTYERYREICRLHILPTVGEVDLSDISVIVLQKLVSALLDGGNRRTGKGLSANFVNIVISVIQNSLKTAYLIGLTPDYTADKIKRPKIVEKQVDCFSCQEQKKIENYVLNSKKDKLFGIVLCLYTGLRIGELLALKWSDIDMAKGTLSVSRSCHDGKGAEGKYIRIEDTPKTSSSCRIIPLSKQLVPYLKKLKKKSSSDYVVSNGSKVISVRSYQETYYGLLKKLDINRHGFHSLRHTFATRALECGMDVKTLSEILGHKNPTVTLNRYVHSLFEYKKDMMNKLGKML